MYPPPAHEKKIPVRHPAQERSEKGNTAHTPLLKIRRGKHQMCLLASGRSQHSSDMRRSIAQVRVHRDHKIAPALGYAGSDGRSKALIPCVVVDMDTWRPPGKIFGQRPRAVSASIVYDKDAPVAIGAQPGEIGRHFPNIGLKNVAFVVCGNDHVKTRTGL